MQRVLVLNAGSSSLKWVVLDAATEESLEQGTATWQGAEGGRHEQELAQALGDLPAVEAVGHRVVHGGLDFREAVEVDDKVRARIVALSELAPLHNPAAVAGLDAARARFPQAQQVAAFDTAFHATLPEEVSHYALPWEWTVRWGLRRFGFHGLSVEYAVSRAHELLGRQSKRMIVCHLGAGCSVNAVADGRSVDTSMGFTPLEGLMMARRSGSVDPGLLLYLLDRNRLSPADLDHGLNEQAGLLGVSGVSADMRDVLAAEAAGNERAHLAVAMFVNRLVSTVGAMTATLGGLDTLVFTGGIGEHSAPIRARVVAALDHLGARLDHDGNDSAAIDLDVAGSDSGVRILVIGAREDLMILRHVKRVLGWS
ncbi:MAG TPA: acetate/propionate family kinase [Chloroflexota bacterium]